VFLSRLVRVVTGSPAVNQNSQEPILVGKVLVERYQVLSELGEGGFGKTYLATDLHIPSNPPPRRVVKRLLSEKMTPVVKRYFQKEAQALVGLNHAQIPLLHASFEVDGIPYIVQDFIDGHDLNREIRGYDDVASVDVATCWTEQDAIVFLADMLGILDYIHSQGIIHRDIKPSNIMRRRTSDQLVLIDFGIVKDINATNSSMTVPIGTRGYMPMEQALGNAQFSSDLYALGTTVLQALTSLAPYFVPIEQRLEQLNKKVSPALSAMITSMVAEDYGDRCPSAKMALTLLQPLTIQNLQGYRSPSRFVVANPPKTMQSPAVTQPQRSGNLAAHQAVTKLENQSSGLPPLNRLPIEIGSFLSGRSPWVKYSLFGAGIFTASGLGVFLMSNSGLFRGTQSTLPPLSSEAPQSSAPSASASAQPNFQSAKEYYDRAEAKYSKLNDNQGALADYNKAIELDPKYVDAYDSRGSLKLDKLNDTQGALADYNKAIELNDRYTYAYYNRGRLRIYELNDSAGALADYNKAIELNPQYTSAYGGRGALKADYLNDSSGALADYNKALSIDPKYAYAYNGRGILKEKLNDFKGAFADYNKAINSDPNYAHAYYLRGVLKAEKFNDISGGLADYNKSIQLDPQHGESYHGRGLLKSNNLNDIPGALADYDKAIELRPELANAYYNRGLLKINKRQDRTGAITDFRQAAKLYRQQNKAKDLKDAVDRLAELGTAE
jgi:serine/threonine protein kinase/Tfp pilus assembly protein PilF